MCIFSWLNWTIIINIGSDHDDNGDDYEQDDNVLCSGNEKNASKMHKKLLSTSPASAHTDLTDTSTPLFFTHPLKRQNIKNSNGKT